MAIPDWPATVTNYVLEDGYSEAPERNVATFETDIGPGLDNRMSSVPSVLFDCVIRCGSRAVYDDLAAFYTDDLKDGVLPFTRTHPATQAPDCVFKFEKGAFKLTNVRGDIHDVSVQLRWLK